ncbi:MAG: hypothetical protein ACK56F_02080, partial [bacterium]
MSARTSATAGGEVCGLKTARSATCRSPAMTSSTTTIARSRYRGPMPTRPPKSTSTAAPAQSARGRSPATPCRRPTARVERTFASLGPVPTRTTRSDCSP